MRSRERVAKAASILLWLMPLTVLGQTTDEAVSELRDSIASTELSPKDLGTSYAAIVNFAVNPAIATAKFYPDSPGGYSDVMLKASRLPFRIPLSSPEEEGASYFLQGLLSRQTLDAVFQFTPDEFMESRWETLGLSMTGGAEFSLSEELTFISAATLGVAHLQNDTLYFGEQTNLIIPEVLDNYLFNWDAKSVVVGGSLALQYSRSWENTELELNTSLTHTQMDSFNESGELINIQGGISTLDVEAQSIHSLPFQLADHDLSLVLIGGVTSFMGPHRDALGFDSFAEAGVGVEVDMGKYEWGVKSIRLGYKHIVGPNVDGWAFMISPQF